MMQSAKIANCTFFCDTETVSIIRYYKYIHLCFLWYNEKMKIEQVRQEAKKLIKDCGFSYLELGRLLNKDGSSVFFHINKKRKDNFEFFVFLANELRRYIDEQNVQHINKFEEKRKKIDDFIKKVYEAH